jgi:hypothetical protein
MAPTPREKAKLPVCDSKAQCPQKSSELFSVLSMNTASGFIW